MAVFAQSSFADAEDFSITVQKESINACSCGLTATTYSIRNTGSVTSTYEIFKSGSAAAYSTLSENYLSLEPGQSVDIINYINLPCDVQGKLDEVVEVKTIFGLSKTFSQELNTGKCANFDIKAIDNLKASCPCSPTQYQIYLRNTGSYDEVFEVNVTKFPEYATISERTVILMPNENRTVSVFYNFPCDVFGEKDLEVQIQSKKSEYLAQIPLKLNIKECYDYDLNGDSSFTVCEGDSVKSQLKVTNNADFSNNFLLETNKNYAQIENNSMFLIPKESGITNLVVDAEKLKAGEYSFNVISTSQKGNSQKAIFSDLTVEKCRDFILNIIKPEGRLIASKQYNYQIEIENTGTRQGTFYVQVDGPDWFSLAQNYTIIGPEKTGTVLLHADIPSDFSGKAYARVFVNEDFVVGYDKITMDVISVEDAYSLDFKQMNNAVRYDFSDINVLMTNNGVDSATYELSLDGPSWMRLTQNEVTLLPGQEATIPIQTSPTEDVPEGKYAVTLVATLSEAGIGYSTSFNVKLYSSTLFEKIYDFIMPLLKAYWLYILIAVGAAAAAIVIIWLIIKLAKKAKEKKKLKKEMQVVKVLEDKKSPKMPATYKPSFQPFATPTIIPEESPRLNIPKEVKPKSDFKWGRLLALLCILIVIAGIVALVILNWGAIAGFVGGIMAPANQTQNNSNNNYAPDLEINRTTGIEGEGNTVYIREDGTIDIPVIIKNKAPTRVVYSIKSANSSWITTDKQLLSLEINQTKTLHVYVNTTPDLPDGTYRISLGLNIDESDLKYSEDIELRIDRQKSNFANYLPYILAGIAVAVILILILALTRRSRFDVKRQNEATKIIRTTERKSVWGIIGKILLIVIIIVVIAGTVYYVYKLPAQTQNNYDESLNLGSSENQTIGLDLGRGDTVIIPFTFKNNFNSAATYDIESDANWIDATDDVFVLYESDVKYVNITASPGEDVEEGIYKANIQVNLPLEDIEYVKSIIFEVKDRSIGKTLLENKFFVIGIAIIIVGVLLLLVFKKRKQEKREFLAEIKQEIELEKMKKASTKKTDIKIPKSAKRTK